MARRLHILLTTFGHNFNAQIDGVLADEVKNRDLTLGARIHRLFYHWFHSEEALLFSDFRTTNAKQERVEQLLLDINVIHQNVRGYRSSAYSEKVMETVVQTELKRMSLIPNQAINIIAGEVISAIPECSDVSIPVYYY